MLFDRLPECIILSVGKYLTFEDLGKSASSSKALNKFRNTVSCFFRVNHHTIMLKHGCYFLCEGVSTLW